jgi:hypothetical protein
LAEGYGEKLDDCLLQSGSVRLGIPRIVFLTNQEDSSFNEAVFWQVE